MDLHLYSEIEGRVPEGAYQRFLSALIRDFFETEALDLAPYLGTLPETAIVRGNPVYIKALKEKLNGTVS